VTPKLSIEPPPVAWQGNEHIAAKFARTVVVLYLLFAFVAGAMIPFQAGINAQLAHWIHSPVRAALVSFVVGTIALLVLSVAIWRPLPSGSRIADAPWWVWIGGLLGAFYVAGSVVVAPRLGAAVLLAAVVAGQLLASLLVDQFGWVGFREHHISPGRAIGMALVLGGVLLVRFF
jgi:bacterial/archaeal transporter family-2 protein